MCDVCRIKKIDPKKLNGVRLHTNTAHFYTAKNSSLKVNLCNYHDRELFLRGEKSFLERHPKILRFLGLQEDETELFA